MEKKLTMILACLFLSIGMAFAQTKVTGTVLSQDDGQPVIGASVLVQGTKTGTTTNIDGQFTLNVPKGKKIQVSYIGMVTQTVTPKPNMKITLQADANTLSDVVVTGIHKIDKRMFTGSAVKIGADETKLSGMADVSRSLEGRVSGVQVSNMSGTFGAAPKIRVRGATSIYGNSKPLWVIDGVIYEDNVDVSADDLGSGDAKTLISSAVAGLNSDDIESFTVLKDGSATSIYGARAMAGVIVVTTKKGAKGRASVNYTGEFTSRLKPSYSNYNIMNSQETMGVYKEMESKGWLQIDHLVNASASGVYGLMYQKLKEYDATTGQFGLENTTAARNKYLQEAEFRNTDWFDRLFNSNISQTHSISVSSGSDKVQTYFSMSLMNDPGWHKRSKVERYTFNGNISYDILKNLTVKLAAQGSHRKQEAPGTLDRTTDVVSGQVNRDFDINPFSFALNTSRCLDPDYSYTRFYTPFNIFHELDNNYNDINVDELMFRAELQYKPISKVTVNGLISTRTSRSRTIQNVMDDSNQANAYRAGTDATDDNSTVRDSNPLLYTDPDNPLALPESVLPQGGIMYQDGRTMTSSNYRITADYRDVFNEKHTVNAMVGMEASLLKRTTTKWTGWGYQYNNGGVVYTPYLWLKQMNEENTDYFSDIFTRTNMLAYYGTGSYTFDGKYTINGTFRYEGSNRLGKSRKSRWMPAWNISGSYNVMGEKFMESASKWLSLFTIRAGYSLTGDAGPANVTNARAIYKSKNKWRPTTSSAESMIELKDLANSELTYEKKHELNIGLDLGFLNDRISLTTDVYWRNNFDLIGRTYVQGFGGMIAKDANVADMKSRGVELGLATVNISNNTFKWKSDLVYTWTKNEITSLEPSASVNGLVTGWYGNADVTEKTIEGYPVRSLFSYRFAGLNEEGLPMVYNERGEITVGDVNFQEVDNLTDFLVYEGPLEPTWYGSFNNSFEYKKNWGKLNLDVYITYSGGNKVRLDPVFSSVYSDLSSFPREMKNRWMVSGDEARTDIPVLASMAQNDRYGSLDLATAYNVYNYSTARTADGTFVRLKEVALTYTMPQNILQKTILNNLSVKLAATNLCLLYADKKLNGQDPEFINAGGVATPLAKQFTMTLRLGF